MQVDFKIARFNLETDQQPYFEIFKVEIAKEASVLEGLFYILENLDGSLAFRYSCRGAVCGSCAMYINGRRRLACQTLIKSLKTKVIRIAPLPHLKIIKDLVVEMEPFFKKYERIKPYLINETAEEKERIQTGAERQRIDEMIKCILCGCCYSACSLVYSNDNFLGPAALTKAYRFAADSRDLAQNERLKLVEGENGIWRCHTLFNCAEACPKEIIPTYSIQGLKRTVVQRRLGLL